MKNNLIIFYSNFVEIIEDVLNGLSTHSIGKKFNISQKLVFTNLKKYGVKTNPKNSPSNRKIINKCIICGTPTRRRNKYCTECIDKNEHIRRHRSLSEAKDVRSRKAIILRIRGNKCENCGVQLWDNKPLVMDLHHIDGNADNNNESNLKLLCPNCHSQTSSYKSKNKNGSVNRRKVYRKNYRES